MNAVLATMRFIGLTEDGLRDALKRYTAAIYEGRILEPCESVEDMHILTAIIRHEITIKEGRI